MHDVDLVDRGQAPAARRGDLEAATRDPLDLRAGVLAGVEPGSVLADPLLAEVEAADELADDHDVDPGRARGPEVRVDAELLAQAEEPLLGPHRLALELGEADGGEEDGVGLAAGRERLVGERRSLREDRVAAERVLGVVDPERVEHADRLAVTSGPIPSPGRHGDVASSARPGRLVGGDLVLVLERQVDVVEAVQQPVAGRLVEGEREAPCRRASSRSAPRGRRSARSRDRGRPTPSAPSPAPPGSWTITIPTFAAFDRKMSPNDGAMTTSKPVVLERPRGVLARRAAAEVASGEQDPCAGELGLVELEARPLVAVLVEAPVEERVLPVARCARSASGTASG